MSDEKTRIIQDNAALDTSGMIVAIAGMDGLKLPEIADKTPAPDVFPKLTRMLLGVDGGFGIDFAFFRPLR